MDRMYPWYFARVSLEGKTLLLLLLRRGCIIVNCILYASFGCSTGTPTRIMGGRVFLPSKVLSLISTVNFFPNLKSSSFLPW